MTLNVFTVVIDCTDVVRAQCSPGCPGPDEE
jgi:hypothetical protein